MLGFIASETLFFVEFTNIAEIGFIYTLSHDFSLFCCTNYNLYFHTQSIHRVEGCTVELSLVDKRFSITRIPIYIAAQK